MPSPQLVIAMGVVMPIVDTFFVGIRLYAKRGKAPYGLDDYLILVALVGSRIRSPVSYLERIR